MPDPILEARLDERARCALIAASFARDVPACCAGTARDIKQYILSGVRPRSHASWRDKLKAALERIRAAIRRKFELGVCLG